MNIYLEIVVSLQIVVLMLYFCYGVIPKNQAVQDFFYTNRKLLSPNMISSWRMYLGIPVIVVYLYAMEQQNYLLVYGVIWMYVFLALTDLLDGIVARNCNLVTSDGASLDAKADKWFDLPALFVLCFYPVFEPIYFVLFIGIAGFDIVGQTLRGKHSPPEAGIFGKTKTTLKFSVIYLMTFSERFSDIYNTLKLEIVILILLFLILIFAGLSMASKTLWYNEYLRRYLKEYLWKKPGVCLVFAFLLNTW